jgi:protein disulfide-isomerase A1
MVYLFAPTESERQELRKALYRFAKSYYDSITTVVVDPLDFPGLMEKLGLEAGVYPAGAVHQLSTDRVFPYPKGRPYTSSAVQQWGLDVYQGRIKPWTPPGVTTSYENPGQGIKATRKVSIASGVPGVKIRVAGRDEL